MNILLSVFLSGAHHRWVPCLCIHALVHVCFRSWTGGPRSSCFLLHPHSSVTFLAHNRCSLYVCRVKEKSRYAGPASPPMDDFVSDGRTSSDAQELNGLSLHRPPCLPQDPLPFGSSASHHASWNQQTLFLPRSGFPETAGHGCSRHLGDHMQPRHRPLLRAFGEHDLPCLPPGVSQSLDQRGPCELRQTGNLLSPVFLQINRPWSFVVSGLTLIKIPL